MDRTVKDWSALQASGAEPLRQEEADLAMQEGWFPWAEQLARHLAVPGHSRPAACLKRCLQSGKFRFAAAAALAAVLGTGTLIRAAGNSALPVAAGVPMPAGNVISVEGGASRAAAIADCKALDGRQLAPGAGVVNAYPDTSGSLAITTAGHGARTLIGGLPAFCAVSVTGDGQPPGGRAQVWLLPLPPAWNGRFKVAGASSGMSPGDAAAAVREGYATELTAGTHQAGRSGQLALQAEHAARALYGVTGRY